MDEDFSLNDFDDRTADDCELVDDLLFDLNEEPTDEALDLIEATLSP